MTQRGVVVRLPVIAGWLAAASIGWAGARSAIGAGGLTDGVGWVIGVSAMVLPIVGAFAAASSAGPDLVVRRFWRQLAVVLITSTGGALINALTDNSVAGRSLSNLLYLFGALTLIYALLRLPVPARSRFGWLTLALDVGVVLTAFVLIAWFLARHSAAGMTAGSGSGSTVYTLLVCGAAGVVCITKVALTGAGGVNSRAIRALGLNALVTAVVAGAGVLFVPDYVSQLILPICALGYTLAADLQRRQIGSVPPPAAARKAPRAYSVLPYLAVAAVDTLLLAVHLVDRSSAPLLAFGSVVLTALVVVRQIAAFRENSRLVTRLDATLSEVERQEHRLVSLLRHSSDLITIVDVNGLVLYAGPGIESVMNIRAEDVVGQRIRDLAHPDDLPILQANLERMLETPGSSVTFQARLARAGGGWRWLEIVSTNLLHDPDLAGIVSNGRDITDNRRYQEELAYQAAHDGLTGLANRTLFGTATDTALSTADPSRTAVALVDLDDFKTINDRLGHTVGDALLKAVSQRLVSAVRPTDTVARLGGDEFAVLLPDVEPSTRLTQVRQILDELAVPVHAHGHELLVRASIGLTSGEPGLDAGELLRRADVAMYAAKATGGGRYAEFDPVMDARAQEHSRLAADLSAAVQRGEIHLRYQPIVSLPDGALTGLEALIRWTNPVRGAVSPAEFVPVAERTGLIVPLGAWVLREACRQAARWLAEYGSRAPGRISVNVSARQLIEPDFPATVASALVGSGLPADRLTMEITETAVFNGGPALEAVQAIRALGVRVALDDFGTGHSSLGLLRTCPVDVLKVDKSFVDGVAVSIEQEAIVTSVSQIGTAMQLQVVAEGVETAQQADRLYTLGYRYAQGFHFARPLTPDELAERLTVPVGA